MILYRGGISLIGRRWELEVIRHLVNISSRLKWGGGRDLFCCYQDFWLGFFFLFLKKCWSLRRPKQQRCSSEGEWSHDWSVHVGTRTWHWRKAHSNRSPIAGDLAGNKHNADKWILRSIQLGKWLKFYPFFFRITGNCRDGFRCSNH